MEISRRDNPQTGYLSKEGSNSRSLRLAEPLALGMSKSGNNKMNIYHDIDEKLGSVAAFIDRSVVSELTYDARPTEGELYLRDLNTYSPHEGKGLATLILENVVNFYIERGYKVLRVDNRNKGFWSRFGVEDNTSKLSVILEKIRSSRPTDFKVSYSSSITSSREE